MHITACAGERITINAGEQNMNETDQAKAGRARLVYDQFTARSSKDDEYKDWTGYRRELTDFVMRTTPAGGSLLILGAGKCNDLDLRKLADHCGAITLSDYRPETVEEAFARYDLAPSDTLKTVASDYVGITDEDYLEYTDRLITVMEKLADCPDLEEAAAPVESLEIAGSELAKIAGPELAALEETLEGIYRRNAAYTVDLGNRAYDNAVVAGVHSQLNNSFRGLFQYVRKDVEERKGEVPLANELNAAVFRMTVKHTGDLVDRFNDALFAAVREGVVYAYEECIIYTPEGAATPAIGTVDGARQAGEAIADFPVKEKTSCLWPLSRRRKVKFEMTVCYLTVGEQQ